MESIDQTLIDHPFFRNMDAKYVDVFASAARREKYREGTFLFREGDTADRIYFVQRGQVAVEIHAPPQGTVSIETVGPGEVLGWSWAMPPFRKSFAARCVTDMEAVVIDATAIREAMRDDHELGYEVLSRLVTIIAHRLQATRLQLIDIYSVK